MPSAVCLDSNDQAARSTQLAARVQAEEDCTRLPQTPRHGMGARPNEREFSAPTTPVLGSAMAVAVFGRGDLSPLV